MSTATGVPVAGLVAFLAWLGVQRVAELRVSFRNAVRLRARGAVEHGARHFMLFVALHVAFPLLLVVEVFAGGARPGRWWPAWLFVLLLAQALRVWSMVALGERWTARVFELPDEPLVANGPYRWMRHPSYVAVTLELLAAPLLFGAWRTAIVVGVANAFALALRLRVESRVLATAPGAQPSTASHA